MRCGEASTGQTLPGEPLARGRRAQRGRVGTLGEGNGVRDGPRRVARRAVREHPQRCAGEVVGEPGEGRAVVPRANIDEFTDVTARALEDVGGAKQGKAIIILNPVEPPMIMRNTVFCAIPAEAAEPGPQHDAIEANVHAIVDTVRQYVPGYTLRAEPQFDAPNDRWRGRARVGVFLEVRGRGDYLPDYAGNLDIITAAAQAADLMAGHLTAQREGASA